MVKEVHPVNAAFSGYLKGIPYRKNIAARPKIKERVLRLITKKYPILVEALNLVRGRTKKNGVT